MTTFESFSKDPKFFRRTVFFLRRVETFFERLSYFKLFVVLLVIFLAIVVAFFGGMEFAHSQFAHSDKAALDGAHECLAASLVECRDSTLEHLTSHAVTHTHDVDSYSHGHEDSTLNGSDTNGGTEPTVTLHSGSLEKRLANDHDAAVAASQAISRESKRLSA